MCDSGLIWPISSAVMFIVCIIGIRMMIHHKELNINDHGETAATAFFVALATLLAPVVFGAMLAALLVFLLWRIFMLIIGAPFLPKELMEILSDFKKSTMEFFSKKYSPPTAPIAGGKRANRTR